MNKNCFGVIKINENEAALDSTRPSGFVVREKIIDGRPVSLEYGTYIDNDVFLGVPVHYSIKPNLMAVNGNSDTNEYNYYLVPQLKQFAVSTYTSKKSGKTNPILVEPTDDNPAVLISSLAFRDNRNVVTNITINDNSLVLRKYIDKDRKVVGLIMINPDSGLINPSTKVTLEYGVLGSTSYNVSDYKFDPTIEGGVFKESKTVDVEEGTLNTSFIKLMSYIKPEIRKNDDETEDRPRRNNNFHKKNFNGNKRPFNKNNK